MKQRFTIIGAAHLDALVEGFDEGQLRLGSVPAERIRLGYGGDAIGHLMSWLGPSKNMAVNNVWAIPSDIIGPLLAIALLAAYRTLARTQSPTSAATPATA